MSRKGDLSQVLRDNDVPPEVIECVTARGFTDALLFARMVKQDELQALFIAHTSLVKPLDPDSNLEKDRMGSSRGQPPRLAPCSSPVFDPRSGGQPSPPKGSACPPFPEGAEGGGANPSRSQWWKRTLPSL